MSSISNGKRIVAKVSPEHSRQAFDVKTTLQTLQNIGVNRLPELGLGMFSVCRGQKQ